MTHSGEGSHPSGVKRREFLAAIAAGSAAAGVGATSGAIAQSPASAPAPRPSAAGTAPLKIGILGTGSIPEPAIIKPAKDVPEVIVDAVGSRSVERGKEYAAQHGIPRALDYDAMLGDPAIDIIYIALPISLHAEWSLKALAAGKHVLCEKSMTANAAEAAKVAAAVRNSRFVFMEAYAYPYHPFAKRVKEILDTGAIGALWSVDSALTFAPRPQAAPVPGQPPRPPSIRRQFETAGGMLLDAGCYPARALCDYLGPVERVLEAKANIDPANPQIDLAMAATLQFAGGRRGRLLCGTAEKGSRTTVIRGTIGTLTIEALNQPQMGGQLRLDWDGKTYFETADSTPSYVYQLRELVRCIRDGAPVLTSAQNGLIVMQAMDAIYTRAGLRLRGTV